MQTPISRHHSKASRKGRLKESLLSNVLLCEIARCGHHFHIFSIIWRFIDIMSLQQLGSKDSSGVPFFLQPLQTSESVLTSESQLYGARPRSILIVSPLIGIGAAHDAKAFLIVEIHFAAVVGIGVPNEIVPVQWE